MFTEDDLASDIASPIADGWFMGVVAVVAAESGCAPAMRGVSLLDAEACKRSPTVSRPRKRSRFSVANDTARSIGTGDREAECRNFDMLEQGGIPAVAARRGRDQCGAGGARR